ncbi:hypothetical protein MRX96_019371 [Rhipicephalus microplus]
MCRTPFRPGQFSCGTGGGGAGRAFDMRLRRRRRHVTVIVFRRRPGISVSSVSTGERATHSGRPSPRRHFSSAVRRKPLIVDDGDAGPRWNLDSRSRVNAPAAYE